jgi:hypothetical protein
MVRLKLTMKQQVQLQLKKKVEGIGFSYTMGSMKIAGNRNEGKNLGGSTGESAKDVDTEIKLSFAF